MQSLPRFRAPPRKNAFSLFCVLVIMFLLLSTALAMMKISAREMELSRGGLHRQIAENAARSATRIALANLQYLAGADSVATSKNSASPEGEREWACVWGAKNPPPFLPEDSMLPERAPLVARGGNFLGNEIFYAKNPADGRKKIALPWEYLDENTRMTYYVIDESQKAPLSRVESANLRSVFPEAELQEIRQISRAELGFRLAFPNAATNSAQFRESLTRAVYDEGFFHASFPQDDPVGHAFAAESFGVLADWKNCKLKSDLSDSDFSDEIFPSDFLRGGSVAATWSDAKKSVKERASPVSIAPAETHGIFRFKEELFPLIVELRLHIGFFNARTDGQHRARFHVSAKLWNPYSFPLLGHGDGNIGLLDFSSMPPAEVRNLDTGTAFSFSFSDFPLGRFGLVSQTESDKTFNAYCKIFDTSDQGFGGSGKAALAGLHGGEVFLGVFPNPAGQPEGLSRITGGATWKYQKNDTSKPPSGTVDGRWFQPSHRIQISAAPSILPGAFLFRRYAGNLPQKINPRDYSEAFWGFENLRVPGFRFEMSGAQYNREKAGAYAIEEASAVYRIRLKTEDSAAMEKFFARVDPRSGVLDFDIPEIADAFEISVFTGADAAALANSESVPAETYFFDAYKNEHRSDTRDAFACVPFFDKPLREHLSTGTVRYFCAEEKVAHALGAKSAPEEKSMNEILDRYFFSGKSSGKNARFVDPREEALADFRFAGTASANEKPAARGVALPGTAAEKLLLRGAFNVNCADEIAWAAVLSGDFSAWKMRRADGVADSQNSSEKDLRNVFFTRPFSAGEIFTGGLSRGFSDAELSALDKRSRERILLAQGFRALEDSRVKALAGALAKRIRERIDVEKKPFRTLAEFADSGVLATAIEDAGVNVLGGEKIPAWMPGFLSQSDVFQTLAPGFVPRGDTFRIIARAESLSPFSREVRASAVAEMRVQRMPEFFDPRARPGASADELSAVNKALGRRFKITGFRLLSHDEM